jgi:PAS domain S-box-containing protein
MQPNAEPARAKNTGAGRVRRATVLTSAALFLVLGALTYGLTSTLRSNLKSDVLSSAVQGADLIGTLGGELPDLTPARMKRGLSPAQIRATDDAVRRAEREGALTAVLLVNAAGRIVYSTDHDLIGTTPELDRDFATALAGHDASGESTGSSDALDRVHGSALDAYVPLSRDNGEVIGALELSQPLAPFIARVNSAQSGYYWAIGGGGFLLWLLSLPFVVRLARVAERNFEPGRRRRLRELRIAIAQRRLELHYQPLVRTDTSRLVGAEALVRWRRGAELIAPDEFLPLAESSGLIKPLTAFVLDEAVAQASAWRRAGRGLSVSVNLSASNLLEPGLPQEIEDALARHGLPADLLHLEITETAVIEDEAQANSILELIAESGVQLSLDDFGTGYSSMTRVSQLPITELKIDRSFVSAMTPAQCPVVQSMIDLAHALGLRVVAEGVEDHATLMVLCELGCELVQGYYFSRPIPAGEFDRWREVRPVGSEDAPELRMEANLDGYCTKLTRAWERCLGFSRDELTTRPFIELVHPDDVEAMALAAVALRERGSEIVHLENRCRAADGSWHRFMWRARSDGETIYAVARELPCSRPLPPHKPPGRLESSRSIRSGSLQPALSRSKRPV